LWPEYVQRFTSHYYHSSLRALYCPLVPFSVPWKRPSGIATAKHALKPTLVPAHRDQRYIILQSFCLPLTAYIEWKVIVIELHRSVSATASSCMSF